MGILPINLEELIHARAIESERREFKKGWDEETRDSVVRTVAAFANDLHNLNGGYVILGIEEQDGVPVLPPRGLDETQVDDILRKITNACRSIIPDYFPVISVEVFMQKTILVIWAPAGEARPYQAPRRGGGRDYYVRVGSNTVEAKGDLLRQLMETASRIPFDDRRRLNAQVSELSPLRVRQFLSDIRSDLVFQEPPLSPEELFRHLRLVAPIDGREAPRNVALLVFSDTPERHFPYARVEVVQFGDDAGGNLIEEKVFRGPIVEQVRATLQFLDGLLTGLVRKLPRQAEALRFVSYPYEAIEEALVNAVIHRGYDGPPEPIKVYLFPDRMEITSYPGPVPGLDRHHLEPEAHSPPPPARNRRIGEFFKELRLAELRGTGIPKIRRRMKENGSPDPVFDFDESRTYFRVTLPAHPNYVIVHALRQAAELWHVGERERAIERLKEARAHFQSSGALAAQLIDYLAAMGDYYQAETLAAEMLDQSDPFERQLALRAMARAYLDAGKKEKATSLLRRLPERGTATDIVDVAILHKRAGDYREAHRLFSSVESEIQDDPKALHEFAQTKMRLAATAPKGRYGNRVVRQSLNRQAAEILRRVISLSTDRVRCGWAWYNLADTLWHLRAPMDEVLQAASKAQEILPEETIVSDFVTRVKQRAADTRAKKGGRTDTVP